MELLGVELLGVELLGVELFKTELADVLALSVLFEHPVRYKRIIDNWMYLRISANLIN
jgi:hypothetical protein